MMQKLPVIIVSLSLLATSLTPAFAQEATPTTYVTPTATVTSPPSLKTNAKATATALRETMQTAKMELKDKIQAARDAMKDKIAAEKAAFQTKVATIKDTQKQTVVSDIDTKISTMNQTRTDEMVANLTRLSQILDSISTRSAAAKAAGQNTATVDSDVTSARSAIALAQTAVTTQAAKSYTITITTDTKLRTNVMTTLAQFRKDINATHKTVVTARDGVRVAAIDLEKLTSVNVTTTPAPTASGAAANQ